MPFIFLLLFFQFANADDCPTYNLLDNPILQSRKDVDQSNLGWCCSFAFTDALSIKYQKQFSAVDIAINQAQAAARFEGCTRVQELAENINKGPGICDENNYRLIERMTIDPSYQAIEIDPDSLEAGKKSGLSSYEMFRIKIKYVEEQKQKIRSQTISYMQLIGPYVELRKIITDHPELASKLCKEWAPTPAGLFKNLTNLKDILDVIQASAGKSDIDFLANLAEKNCSNRQKLAFQTEKLPMDSIDSFKQSIISALAAGNSPILAIDSKTLFKNGPKSQESIFSIFRPNRGNHAVNIVGMKKSADGKCLIKIRDSSFGGLFCKTRRKSETDIICSEPEDEKYMTYEIDIERLKKNTFDGAIIK